MSPDRRKMPKRTSDIWQIAVLQVLADYLFSAPRSILDLIGKVGITLGFSVIAAIGVFYWRHPEIVSFSVYRENPVAIRLNSIPKAQKEQLLLYTEHIYKKSDAQWLGVFDWRTLKDMLLIVSHGNIPASLKDWSFLPRDWAKIMPNVIYEECYPKSTVVGNSINSLMVCPILGDEDVWGLIVLYGVPKTNYQEIENDLRILASRWSDYLY